jgi:hypothetical protein
VTAASSVVDSHLGGGRSRTASHGFHNLTERLDSFLVPPEGYFSSLVVDTMATVAGRMGGSCLNTLHECPTVRTIAAAAVFLTHAHDNTRDEPRFDRC